MKPSFHHEFIKAAFQINSRELESKLFNGDFKLRGHPFLCYVDLPLDRLRRFHEERFEEAERLGLYV